MPAIRTTTLLASMPPVVKKGEVIVPVRTGTGEIHGLRAPASLFHGISAAIQAEEDRQHANKTGRPSRRASGKCPGCDNHGCADCVAASRPPILKPGCKRIL